MGFQWDVEPGLAFEEFVSRYTHAVFLTGVRVAEARAVDGEQWMKQNAPWQDRTGLARRSLRAYVLESPGVFAEVVFEQGKNVPYGIWLEVANGGRYAIVAPAVSYWGRRLMQDVQRIINLQLAARG